MAENTVVKEQLTDGMIEAGAELTRKLDELGLPLTAAYWYFMPETNEWRLLFASPEVSAKGPRSVYSKIDNAVQQLGAKAAAAPFSAIASWMPMTKSSKRSAPWSERGQRLIDYGYQKRRERTLHRRRAHLPDHLKRINRLQVAATPSPLHE